MLSEMADRLGRIDRRLLDAGAALLALLAIELTVWLTPGISASDRAITAVMAVLFAAPIAVRRVWPAAALVFSTAVVTVSPPLGSQLLTNDNAYVIPVLILGYAAGAWAPIRRSVLALSLGLGLLWAWALLPGPDGSTNGFGQSVWALFYVTALLVPSWLVGRLAHRHRVRASAFGELAALAATERDARDAAAIADERARIGSELQDIIAHSISAMVIQAGSARLLLRADPDRARGSILTVEETGRQALSDLRRLLGMLRKDGDPRALSPQPGLGQLAALTDALRAGELKCQWRTIGDPVDLTPGVDLVAYRVIEAALRRAEEAHAHEALVTVRYTARSLELEICSEGPIALLGGTFAPLEQRVALYDGELQAEASGEGFAVRARLPLEVGASA